MIQFSRYKCVCFLISFVFLFSCGKSHSKSGSVEVITDAAVQDSIFKNLNVVIHSGISDSEKDDSLAFLILPVHASCPYCRKKTIDSIVAHEKNLPDRHYIIISAKGGTKTIRSYFREQEKELPGIANKVFLDTTNLAFKYNLYEDKPMMYYAHGGRVYRKVSSTPVTVKDDLHYFFSSPQ